MNKKGGARTGAGRKPKAEEQELIETLKPMHSKAMEAMQKGLEDADFRYVKLFMSYFYGSPSQMVEITSPQEKNLPEWMNEVSDIDLKTVSDIVDKASIPFESWNK